MSAKVTLDIAVKPTIGFTSFTAGFDGLPGLIALGQPSSLVGDRPHLAAARRSRAVSRFILTPVWMPSRTLPMRTPPSIPVGGSIRVR